MGVRNFFKVLRDFGFVDTNTPTKFPNAMIDMNSICFPLFLKDCKHENGMNVVKIDGTTSNSYITAIHLKKSVLSKVLDRTVPVNVVTFVIDGRAPAMKKCCDRKPNAIREVFANRVFLENVLIQLRNIWGSENAIDCDIAKSDWEADLHLCRFSDENTVMVSGDSDVVALSYFKTDVKQHCVLKTKTSSFIDVDVERLRSRVPDQKVMLRLITLLGCDYMKPLTNSSKIGEVVTVAFGRNACMNETCVQCLLRCCHTYDLIKICPMSCECIGFDNEARVSAAHEHMKWVWSYFTDEYRNSTEEEAFMMTPFETKFNLERPIHKLIVRRHVKSVEATAVEAD